MGIAAETTLAEMLSPESGLAGWQAALAALEWQIEAGVSDILLEDPLDRYDLPATAPDDLPQPAPKSTEPARAGTPAAATTATTATRKPASQQATPRPDLVAAEAREALAMARQRAAQAPTIRALHQSLAGYEGCDLRRGARSMIFAQGDPAAHVMVIGDPPQRAEDLAGLPFQGPEGALLDAMFAAIGLQRQHPDPARALYLAPCLPWPTPLDREPSATEIDQIRPFVLRHIELAAPRVVVLMGNAACHMVLDQGGIQRLRGGWITGQGSLILPMFAPRWLLKHPAAKREAWADLLALKARLQSP